MYELIFDIREIKKYLFQNHTLEDKKKYFDEFFNIYILSTSAIYIIGSNPAMHPAII